jgi:transposase
MKNKFTITEFHDRFPDDATCLEELKQLVFGDTLDCPKPQCGKHNRFYRVKGRTAYACSFCGHHIYPLKGTPFAHSSTSLKTWFIWLHRPAAACLPKL